MNSNTIEFMDAKKIKESLKGEADRASFTVYFSSSIYEDFKKHCGKIAPSRVIEELMKDFIQSSRTGKPVKRTKIKN